MEHAIRDTFVARRFVDPLGAYSAAVACFLDGVENIPKPPYIIAANHQAWYDPAFIIPFFPESPVTYTMAKRETVFNHA